MRRSGQLCATPSPPTHGSPTPHRNLMASSDSPSSPRCYAGLPLSAKVAGEALAIAHMTSAYTVEWDWGPLLARASPHPQTARGGLSPAQRRFLTAIADNDDCWGRIANPQIWFRNAGLPTDRRSAPRPPRHASLRARELTGIRQRNCEHRHHRPTRLRTRLRHDRMPVGRDHGRKVSPIVHFRLAPGGDHSTLKQPHEGAYEDYP